MAVSRCVVQLQDQAGGCSGVVSLPQTIRNMNKTYIYSYILFAPVRDLSLSAFHSYVWLTLYTA